MAVVNRKYLPGYTGTCTLDTADYPVQGWSSDHDPGLWDAMTDNDGGWMYQEAGAQKVSFTFTILCKATDGIPTFVAGQTIAAVFKINNVAAYSGNVIVTKLSTKNDLKGGVTFDVTADSQGAMTGSLVPTGLVVTPPSGQ